jgi:2-oxoglutarate ferredoxin oxidoreductase subunit gamma
MSQSAIRNPQSAIGLYEEIVIAGFGGQGIILVGKLLAQTAMRAGVEVTYMPSYGAEVRGGTANCMIVISNRQVACPVVGRPNSLIAMNKASVAKFGPQLKPGGLLVFNSSLVTSEPELDPSVEAVGIPADDIAVELGSPKSANMVMLGAYLGKRSHFTAEQVGQAMPDVLAERLHKTIPVNLQAVRRGVEFVLCHA